MKKWELFSKEELEKFVQESTSIAQVAEKIGYSKTGGSSQASTREMIKFYEFDTSHFYELNGISHNKGVFDYSRFKKGNAIKAVNMLNAIVALRGHQCEKCLNKVWLEQPITLEVHHKDGDSLNNELDNLELLCPNCHSITENWRGKNINKKENKNPISEEEFVEALKNSPNIRQALLKVGLAAKGGNYTRANELIIKYQIAHLIK